VQFVTSWVKLDSATFGLVYYNAATPITDLICALLDLMQPCCELNTSRKVLENECCESWKTLEFSLHKYWKAMKNSILCLYEPCLFTFYHQWCVFHCFQDDASFIVYVTVTACVLGNYFILHLIHAVFSKVSDSESFQTAEITFKVIHNSTM